MKIKDLVKVLNRCNPEATVTLGEHDTSEYDVVSVLNATHGEQGFFEAKAYIICGENESDLEE